MKEFLDNTKNGAITVWLDGEGQYEASVHDDQRQGKATAIAPRMAASGVFADFNGTIDAEIAELETKLLRLKEEKGKITDGKVTEPGKVDAEARQA